MLLSLALIFLCGLALGRNFPETASAAAAGMLFAGILLGPLRPEPAFDSSILGISADLRADCLIIIPYQGRAEPGFGGFEESRQTCGAVFCPRCL